MDQWMEANNVGNATYTGDPYKISAYTMIGLNWFNLLFNQIFVKTILLAFLISLIKGILAEEKKSATEHLYA